MLEVKNLMVFYENAIAINNINMKCEQGKVTGVFGANSAGKIYTDVHHLGDYFGCEEEGRDEGRRTDYCPRDDHLRWNGYHTHETERKGLKKGLSSVRRDEGSFLKVVRWRT